LPDLVKSVLVCSIYCCIDLVIVVPSSVVAWLGEEPGLFSPSAGLFSLSLFLGRLLPDLANSVPPLSSAFIVEGFRL